MKSYTRRLASLTEDRALLRFASGVIAFLVVIFALVWGGVAWVLQTKQVDALESEKQQNVNLAHTLAEQSLRVFQSVDQATLRVNAAIASGEFVNEDLLRFTRETGLADTIITQLSYVGADGRFIASNIDLSGAKTGAVDLSEREHVKVHLAPPSNETAQQQVLFIGKSVVGKVSGKRTIQLSRKLSLPDGTVKGVVVASINPDYFEQTFKVLNLDTRGQVAIVGRDGAIRAAVKGGESDDEKTAPDLWTHQIDSMTGAVTTRSLIDTGAPEAIFAVKQIGHYPVYLVVQTSVKEALRHWYDMRAGAVGITLLFSLALLAAAFTYLLGIQKLAFANKGLEEKVRARTKELSGTLENLKSAQSQLIQSEKLATLGQIVANVAHEINTPIGAVKSSGESIAVAVGHVLAGFPAMLLSLDEATRDIFFALVAEHRQTLPALSTREERQLQRAMSTTLAEAGIAEPQQKADLLLAMRVRAEPLRFAGVLSHPRAMEILGMANQIGTIIGGTENINLAVERVAKIIFALKSFTHANHTGEAQRVDLKTGLETVLTIYGNQIKQGVEVTRIYGETPLVECLPDELNQVWTNLIHNALQAMQNSGTLTVKVAAQDGGVVVSIADNGPGIPEDIRGRIFDPFFTTKPVGEGSGLGLDIARKIVDKHHGRLELHSEVGVGTTFSVWLPCAAASTEATL